MEDQFKPSLTEAYIPEDGGWTSFNGINVLLLSIPQIDQLVRIQNKGYSYVWLYDKEMDGHIFCFKLNSGEERAVLFKNENAGRLLLKEEAKDLFHIAVASTKLEEINDDTFLLWLPSVEFTPRPLP